MPARRFSPDRLPLPAAACGHMRLRPACGARAALCGAGAAKFAVSRLVMPQAVREYSLRLPNRPARRRSRACVATPAFRKSPATPLAKQKAASLGRRPFASVKACRPQALAAAVSPVPAGALARGVRPCPRSSRMGLATKTEEYVPARMPMSMARAKSWMTAPPKK